MLPSSAVSAAQLNAAAPSHSATTASQVPYRSPACMSSKGRPRRTPLHASGKVRRSGCDEPRRVLRLEGKPTPSRRSDGPMPDALSKAKSLRACRCIFRTAAMRIASAASPRIALEVASPLIKALSKSGSDALATRSTVEKPARASCLARLSRTPFMRINGSMSISFPPYSMRSCQLPTTSAKLWYPAS
eukprot:scaffold33992_cov31-Tisochrysis_lutea.AAC.3